MAGVGSGVWLLSSQSVPQGPSFPQAGERAHGMIPAAYSLPLDSGRPRKDRAGMGDLSGRGGGSAVQGAQDTTGVTPPTPLWI